MSRLLLAVAVSVMAFLCAGFPLTASAAAPAGPQVSAAANKAMTAAKKAADAKQFDAVVTEAGKVLALPNKTPYDAFVAHQFLVLAYAQKNDIPRVLESLQGQIDSGFPQGAELTRVINDLAHIAYDAKNYAKAEEAGTQLIKLGAADASIYGVVGNSMYLQGRHADAARLLGEHVADLAARGQVPGEKILQVLLTAREKAGDRAGVTDTLEALVMHYPKPDYWRLVLQSAARDVRLSERQKVQLYRLRMATESLGNCAELLDMSDILTRIGMAAESQRVMESGIAGRLCTEKADQDALKQSLAAASGAAQRARDELKELEAEARASSAGELDVVLGSSLFGFGEFAGSAEALGRGVGKGGIKDMIDAQLVLGIAQFRAGDKLAAGKTFRSIKADDPFNARLARLWALQAR